MQSLRYKKGGIMNWLRKIRYKKNLTQCQVAANSNISLSYYCLIESGKRRPSVTIAKRIGKSLGFSWSRFYDLTDEKGEK